MPDSNTPPTDETPASIAANLIELPIQRELQDSYLTYAMSVIVSRALPDVRDGLKPSQRRILVAMNDLDLRPGSHYRKCAKIVGDTTGNYHPHGGEVVYPTLVRLAQPFNMRYPLVDGQGNFGSIDGYRAAAMRYTESRMSKFAALLLEDLSNETVDYIPNYEETRNEPTVLPSKLPNLLVNGSSGIAVGMATSIPPHNLNEIADALIHVIDNPDCPIDDLIKIVSGPDFPTGGIICGQSGIRRAYRTGKGKITVRSRTSVETRRGDRKNIIVTEIPYQLQKQPLITRIADAIKSDLINGVVDVVDESDRHGMRIVIKLAAGIDENIVYNQLWKHTQLQDTFSMNMIALVNGRPMTLNLKQLLEQFRDHRVDVVTRRLRNELRIAEAKRHDLEGLLIAVEHIDEIIKLIRSAPNVDTAREQLIKRYELSRRQAEVVLNMRLARLVALERDKLTSDHKALVVKIEDLKTTLSDPALILAIIKEDTQELAKKYGDKRRTEITDAAETLAMEDLIAVEPMAITVSHVGYLKRMKLSSYRKQRRGGKGIIGAATREADFTEQLTVCSTHDTLLFFTNTGRVLWQRVFDLPLMGRTAAGRPVASVLKLKEDEKISACLALPDFDEGSLVMATAKGKVKRTAISEFSKPRPSGIIAIKLAPDDELVGVVRAIDTDELVLATSAGQAVRFAVTDARQMGRSSAGVLGVRLKKKDKVVSIVRVEEGLDLVAISERGFAKRTEIGEYRLMKRGGQGVINMKLATRTGPVVACFAAHETDEVLVMTAGGLVVRTEVKSIRKSGRSVMGVRVMRIDAADRLIAAERVEALTEEEASAGAESEKKKPTK